ncbi:MAG: DNA primase [Pirellulales bacterium]|nr:DNA primase [Pirellulales bacterium]
MPLDPFADVKEQIRRAVDIVDLVGSYLPLRREGRYYKGLCPWHDDRRPSLQVNPERQTFKCWVCDLGGDIFSFVMKKEGVDFREALGMLAERAGISLAGRGGGQHSDDRRRLYQALAWAEDEYHRALLLAPEAEAARRYLAERGISEQSVRRFRLGFAPDRWDWLQHRARETSFGPELLAKVGLLAERRGGLGYYDRFKGRLIFPIRDALGRPVGMGGRLVPGVGDGEGAKYINTPETPLFAKHRLLYGLDQAREAMAKTRAALVMEGYTDCIVAHQFGFANAVAVLGTALGERHVQELRAAERVVMVLDGDEAGRRRAEQILELFVAAQADLRILTLPDGLDPCDFLQQRGGEAFARLVATAPDALEHRFALATQGLDGASETHAANRAVESVLATLARRPAFGPGVASAAQLKEDQILTRLMLRFGVSEQRLRERLRAMRQAQPASSLAGGSATRPSGRVTTSTAGPPRTHARLPSGPHTDPALRRRLLAERWLLEILLQTPALTSEVFHELHPRQLRDARHAALLAAAYDLYAAGLPPDFTHLLDALEDPEVKSLLIDLDAECKARPLPQPGAELRKLKTVLLEAEAEVAPPSHTASEEEHLAALQRVIHRERTRQGISLPTDG